MPLTPFHFGPATLAHAIAPKQVSFLSFCVANVLIDIEPLYYLLHGEFPLHRFFHTYMGATLIVAATCSLFWLIPTIAQRFRLSLHPAPYPLTPRRILLGAMLGSYSHILLDSIMHGDIQPLAPWRADNPLLLAISLTSLHAACLLAGVIGYLIITLRQTPR